MSIFYENNIKLTNLNYFLGQISKIRSDKIVIECNYTSLSQSEYDNFVNLIYDNPFITKIEILWHDFVKLKVLEKLALAFRKYFDEGRKLQKLKLVLSVFKPYPSNEMQQNLKSIFSIYTHRISLKVKFRKEFLSFESFFQLLCVPEQNISSFQISLELTGQIKPLNISFLFSYLEQILQKNQLNRLGVKVKINQVYYQHFNTFLITLQNHKYLKDIELDISELTNSDGLLNSFEIPIFQNKQFIQQNRLNISHKNQSSAKKLSFFNQSSSCTTQKNSLSAADFNIYDDQQQFYMEGCSNKNNFFNNQNDLSECEITESDKKLSKQFSLQEKSDKKFNNSLHRQSSLNQQFQFSFQSKNMQQEENKNECFILDEFEKCSLDQRSSLDQQFIQKQINQDDKGSDKNKQNIIESQKKIKQEDLSKRLQSMNQKYKLKINDQETLEILDSFKFSNNKSKQQAENNQMKVNGYFLDVCSIQQLDYTTCKKGKYDQIDIQEEQEIDPLVNQPNTLRLGNLGKTSQKIQYKDLFRNVQQLVLRDLEFDLIELLTNLVCLKSLNIQKSCLINISKSFQQQYTPQLEQLEVNQENLIAKQSSKLCQVISQMKSIKKLKIQSIYNYEDLIKITENLRLLEELSLKIELKKGENQFKYIKQVYWNLNRIKNLKRINFMISDNSLDYGLLFGFIKQQKSLEVIYLDFYLNKQYVNYIKQMQQGLCQNQFLTKIQIKIPSLDSQSAQFLILLNSLNKNLKYLTQIDLGIETSDFFQQKHLYQQVVQARCFEKLIHPYMIFNPKLILWDLILDD